MKTQTNEVTIETGKMAMRLLKTRYGLDASLYKDEFEAWKAVA